MKTTDIPFDAFGASTKGNRADDEDDQDDKKSRDDDFTDFLDSFSQAFDEDKPTCKYDESCHQKLKAESKRIESFLGGKNEVYSRAEKLYDQILGK